MLGQFHNTIWENEATFKVLQMHLDLRIIYHKKHECTMTHLHMGLSAYRGVKYYQTSIEKMNHIVDGVN